MSSASRRRRSGRLSGAVFEPVSPEAFSVRWHPITSAETVTTDIADIMSSPDPLNDATIDASFFFPNSSVKRAPPSSSTRKPPPSATRPRPSASRRASPRKQTQTPQLPASTTRSATRSLSPRKQTFELQVGDDSAPQRLYVTVETDENAPPSSVNPRRKLFQSPASEPTIRRREQATTTTVPLKVDDELSPRKRGRPRKTNGTPVPKPAPRRRAPTPAKLPKATPRRLPAASPSDTDDILSVVDSQETPRRRGRLPKNQSTGSPEPARSSASRPSPRRGRPPRPQPAEPSSEVGAVPSSVLTAPKTGGRRRRVAMDQEELIQMADLAIEGASIEEQMTPVPSDNEMDLIVIPSVEEQRVEARASPTPGDKSEPWPANVPDEPTPRPRKRTSSPISAHSPARKRRTRSSSKASATQDAAEEPLWLDLTPTRAPADELQPTNDPEPANAAPEMEYPDLPAGPSDASSLMDEPFVDDQVPSIGADAVPELGSPIKETPETEAPPADLPAEIAAEENTRRATMADEDRDHSVPEPRAPYPDLPSAASNVSSADGSPAGDRTDTIAQGEDFSMIFMDSIPSLQASFRQSYQSAPGAPVDEPSFDEHEIGEETHLIINNTLESLRQSQLGRVEEVEAEQDEDEDPGAIFDRSQLQRFSGNHSMSGPERDDRATTQTARDGEEAAGDVSGQQGVPGLATEDQSPQQAGEDEAMPDASPFPQPMREAMPTPQKLPAERVSFIRQQSSHEFATAPVSSSPSPAEANGDSADSPLSENSADPSPSHAFSFAYARSPRKMSSPLRHQVLRATARQARVDADIPEEDAGVAASPHPTEVNGAQTGEDTNMYEDSFSEIPDQVLAAATPHRATRTMHTAEPMSGQQAETTSENMPDHVADDEDDVAMVLQDTEGHSAPAVALESHSQVITSQITSAQVIIQPEPEPQTESNATVEDPGMNPANLSAEPEQGRLPTPDDTPPHPESEGENEIEEDKTPETQAAPLPPSSSSQPSPVAQTEGEEHTEIEMQAPNRRAIPSLQPQLSIEHVGSLPKVTPVNQFSSPAQDNSTLMPPENALARSARRPTLSPIVRAGRVLQSVTSDPPSPEGRDQQLGSPFRSSASKDSDRNQPDRRVSASPPRRFGFPHARSSSVGAPPANDDPFQSTSRSGKHTSFFQSLGRSRSSAVRHRRAISQESLSSLRHAPSADEEMSWIANEGPISPRLRGDNTLREAALATFGAPDLVPPSRPPQRQMSSELGDADFEAEQPQQQSVGASADMSAAGTINDLTGFASAEPVEKAVEERPYEPVEEHAVEPVEDFEGEARGEPATESKTGGAVEPDGNSDDDMPQGDPEEETDIWEFEASRITPESAKRQEPFGKKAPEPILRPGTLSSPWKPGKRREYVREPSPELHAETLGNGTELPSDADEFSLLAAQRRAEEQKARGGESASKANRFDLSSFFSSPAAIPGLIAAKTRSLLGSKPSAVDSAGVPAPSPWTARVGVQSMGEEPTINEATRSVRDNGAGFGDKDVPDVADRTSSPRFEPQVLGPDAQSTKSPEMVQVPAAAVPHQKPTFQRSSPRAAPPKPTLNPPRSLYPRIPQKKFELSSPRRDLFSPAKITKGKQREATPEQTGSESPPTPTQIQRPLSGLPQQRAPRPRQPSRPFVPPSSADQTEAPSRQASVAQTPPRMQLSHADIAKWREEANGADDDGPAGSPGFRRPLLRPLPPKNASPKKSSLRSPLKPHTPGPVVEFTSSVLSPFEQQQARRSAARGTVLGRDLFSQPAASRPETTGGTPQQQQQQQQQDSDVVMTDASPASSRRSPPKALSETVWTREHWLLMDQLLQLRRKGPFEGGFDRSAASERLVGRMVTSQGEGMRLQSWHMDCVDAFRFEVGGWDEGVLAKRLFALLLGEVRRAKGLEGGGEAEDVEEEEESMMFH